MSTHYDTLGLRRRAAQRAIHVSYATIQYGISAALLQPIGPFQRAQLEIRRREVEAAYKILSNTTSRAVYDATLPPAEEFDFDDLYSDSASGTNSENGKSTSQGTSDHTHDSDTDNKDKSHREGPVSIKDAEYRYMITETGTVVQIVISGWHVEMNLSPKFELLNNFVEHSDRDPRNDVVSFEFGVKRCVGSDEAEDPAFNELTIQVTDIPYHKRVKSLSTYYKEIGGASTLQITLESDLAPLLSEKPEWEFGFDFDLFPRVIRGVKKHATHVMFMENEPPEHYKRPLDVRSAPDFKLKRDEDLKAVNLLDLGLDRCIKIRYGGTGMWRLAAVGCNNSFLGGDA